MWDERYRSEHYVYGKNPNDFLRQNVDLIPQGNVLCLAEGEGRNAVYLASQGYQVTAVDASLVGLQKAEKLAQEYDVTINLIHQDLADFTIEENAWDGIVSIFCHLPEVIRKKLHKSVVPGLRKNGVILLEAYTPDQLGHGTGGPPSAELMMSESGLREELEGLDFSLIRELERNIIEGTHHSGIGAVVQLIGVKPDGGQANNAISHRQ